MDKKRIRPEVNIPSARLDAVSAIEERGSFHKKAAEEIDATRAKLYSQLPGFQVPMFSAKFVRGAKPEPMLKPNIGKMEAKTVLKGNNSDSLTLKLRRAVDEKKDG